MEKYLKYAEHLNANSEVISWIEANLNNHLKNNEENQTEIEHIIDYLVSEKAPKRLKKMSFLEAKKNTDKWNKSLVKKGSRIEESASDVEIIKDFKDGFKIVKLVGENAFKREGFLMRHCVASYFGKDTEVFLLRDKNNVPHCTMEKDQQIKGKGNGSINPKYIKYIVSFLEETGMIVGDSEMKNLGYVNIKRIKEKLHPTLNNFYNDNYLFMEDDFIGKDKEEFLNLSILDFKPLLLETASSLKINFELPKLIKASLEYMSSKMEINNYAQNASSGDYAKNASSGYYATEIITGKNSVCATIGKNSKIKAIKGTWITLAEYNNNGECKLVKSALIDGKFLKENIFYILKDGEFTEWVSDE